MTAPTTLSPAQHAWLDLIEQEVRELFAPARSWQRAAPVERSLPFLDLLHDVVVTMVAWGWAIEIRIEKKVWIFSAFKSGADLDIRGTGRAETYPEALVLLADALTKAIAARRRAVTRPSIAA